MRLLAAFAFVAGSAVAAFAQPVITSIAPPEGPTSGGTVVTIAGTDLYAPHCTVNCNPVVTFGGAPATVIAYEARRIVVVAPEHAAGAVDVKVTRSGESATLPAAYAYGGTGWERFLVPFAMLRLAGGSRSLWANEFGGFNDSDHPVRVYTDPLCETCASKEIGAHRGAQLDDVVARAGGASGAFLWVKRPDQENLSFHLFITDITRRGEMAGTEIPVVSEREAFSGRTINLINIPLGPATRSNLRIYDFDGATGRDVTIRLYGSRVGGYLGERKVRLSASEGPVPQYPTAPGFAFVPLEQLPEVAGITGALRVEILTSEDQRLWAFVAVTNNSTSQVRTITPQTAANRSMGPAE